MNYKVLIKKMSFEIFTESELNCICKIDYKSYFSIDAVFKLNASNYLIKSNNIWQTKFDIFKDNKDIGDIDPNWKGEIIIRLKNNETITKHFILKAKGMFQIAYELRDFLTNHLWTIKPVMSKFRLNHFIITREEGFIEEENKVNELELMTATVYALNLYMRSQHAAAAT